MRALRNVAAASLLLAGAASAAGLGGLVVDRNGAGASMRWPALKRWEAP